MNDMRKNGLVGIVEKSGLYDTSMHFAEWWNGEGFDVCFDENEVIKLHQTQLHALMVLSLATEYVSLDDVLEDVDTLLKDSDRRDEVVETIKSEILANHRRKKFKIVPPGENSET